MHHRYRPRLGFVPPAAEYRADTPGCEQHNHLGLVLPVQFADSGEVATAS